MAISISNRGQSSFTVNWTTHAGTITTYNLEVYASGTTTSPVKSAYNIISSVRSYGIQGLTVGTSYDIKLYSRNGSTTVKVEWFYDATTLPALPTGVGTITATPSQTSVALSWTSGVNQANYVVEIWLGSTATGTHISSTLPTTRSTTVTGLSPSTTYTAKVFGRNETGNGTPSTRTFTTQAIPVPSTPSNFRVTTTYGNGFTFAWTASSRVDNYVIEIYHSTSDALVFANRSISSTATTIRTTGSLNYITYYAKLFAQNEGGNSTPVYIYNIRTLDETQPTLNILTSSGKGQMTVTYSASDAHSGMRAGNTYALAISTAGTSGYTHVDYVTTEFYSFLRDGAGNAFQDGVSYSMRVTAYDASNNNVSQYATVTYETARPVEWNWWTNKTKGALIDIKADEWNSFGTKINQFRAYKKLSLYNFTSVSKDTIITASIVNQARTAIGAMSPSVSVPPVISKSDLLTAYVFNRLRDSLNSIA